MCDGSQFLERFLKEATDISKRGQRSTTEDRVCSLLGRHARSTEHFEAACKVLNGHLVDVKLATPRVTSQDNAGTVSKVTPLPNGRAATSQSLHSSGIVASFTDGDLCASSRQYLKTWAGRGGKGRAHLLANAKMIHRVIVFAREQDRLLTEPEAISKSGIEKEFVYGVSGILKPNSIRNHAGAMISLMETILTDRQMADLYAKVSKPKIRQCITYWRDVKREFDRKSRALHRVEAMSGRAPCLDIYQILSYMDDLRQRHGDRILRELSGLKSGFREVPLHLQEHWRGANCLIGCFLLLQGQRLATVQGMTMGEVERATSCLGRRVVRISSNKTFSTSGAACIAVPCHQYTFMESFLEIRRKMLTPETSLLVSVNGKHVGNVIAPLQKYMASRHRLQTGQDLDSDQIVTNKMMRRAIETHLYLLPTFDLKETQDRVALHLCHGEKAVAAHYRYKTDVSVVMGSQSVQSVVALILSIDLVKRLHLLPQDPKGLIYFQILNATTNSRPVSNTLLSLSLFHPPGDFPSKFEVDAKLEKAWPFADLSPTRLSDQAYAIISHEWRELLRDEMVLAMHQEMSASKAGPFSNSDILQKIESLPHIWREDKNSLLSCLRAMPER